MKDDEFDAVAAAAELDASMADEDRAPRRPGGADRYVAMLEAEVEALGAELARRDAQVAAADARADQAAAEIERVAARLQREAGRELERRTGAVLLGLLAVLDDLDRAIAASRVELDGSPFFEGMELVQRGFLAALARHGVTPVEALGEPFDPAVHEAMGLVPATGPDQAGRVVAVLRAGYRHGEGLLRPAGVVVARAA